MMPNHNVTDNSRFTAHSTGEAQSDFQKNIVRSAKDVFAGTCGGITVTLLGHPFDTVKVRETEAAEMPRTRAPDIVTTRVFHRVSLSRPRYTNDTSPFAPLFWQKCATSSHYRFSILCVLYSPPR